MPRLEGQLHVLPARLLLGVAGALDVCGMPRSPSWRAAFLSATAALVLPTLAPGAPHQHHHHHQHDAQQRAGSPGRSMECSALEVLALARHVCGLYAQPGSSDEALGSAALTERLVTVLRAGALAAAQLGGNGNGSGVAAAAAAAAQLQGGPHAAELLQQRLADAAEAAQALLEGGGALARVEAFPARVVLQVRCGVCARRGAGGAGGCMRVALQGRVHGYASVGLLDGAGVQLPGTSDVCRGGARGFGPARQLCRSTGRLPPCPPFQPNECGTSSQGRAERPVPPPPSP